MHIGPTLLCRSKLAGASDEELYCAPVIDSGYRCTSIERGALADGINLSYNLVLENGKETLRLNVCDYASGTNVISDDKHLFSIYF